MVPLSFSRPKLTLVAARKERAEARQLILEGIDPGEQKKVTKLAQTIPCPVND